MAQTNSTVIPPAIRGFYDRILLERALPSLVHSWFGQQRPVKKNAGDQPTFRRYNSLTVATAPIVEGVDPTPQAMSKTDVTGQLVQYGAYVEITDYIEMTSEDRVLAEAATILGENMGETLDITYRDALAAGSSAYYANGVAGTANIVAKLSAADLDKIIRALENNNAKYFKDKPIVGTDKVGTTPIAPSYYAIVDAYTAYDLNAVLTTSFIPVQKYPNPSEAMDFEIGSYRNIRFVRCSNAKVKVDSGGSATAASLKYTTANSACDVRCTLIFGQNAYGITPLDGNAARMIVKSKSEAGSPLELYSTSGWQAVTDCVILNDNFMYRYEHGVSA